jgi:hypothetical protein
LRTRRLFTAAVAALAVVAFLPTQSNAAGGATASFTKVQDWGSGFEGKVTVTNGGTSALTWTVEFDLPAGAQVTSSWDSVRTSSGQHYTFTAPTWAGSLAAGASTSFGFNGSPGNFGGILNCKLNGGGCDGGTTPRALLARPVRRASPARPTAVSRCPGALPVAR